MEILDLSNITPEHLQDKTIGPCKFSAFKEPENEERRSDGYIILLMGYTRSPFRDFESILRIVIGLHEADMQLISKQCNSVFVVYKKTSGIYTIKDISETVYTMGDHEGTLETEYDDISMKPKFILTTFGGMFGTARFDEKPLF